MQTVDLTSGHGVTASIALHELFPRLVGTISPQTVALRAEPYVALSVFLDVYGKAIECLYHVKGILSFIEYEGLVHGSGPQPVPAVTENAVTAASCRRIFEPVCLCRSSLHIHADDVGTVSSEPQSGPFSEQSVDIIFPHGSLAGEIHELSADGIIAVDAGIVGGNPYMVEGILDESAHHIASEVILVVAEIGFEPIFESRGRDVSDTAIECTYPQSALAIGGYAVDKPVERVAV